MRVREAESGLRSLGERGAEGERTSDLAGRLALALLGLLGRRLLALALLARRRLLALALGALGPALAALRLGLAPAAARAVVAAVLALGRVLLLLVRLAERLGIPLDLGLDEAGAASLELVARDELEVGEVAVRVGRGRGDDVREGVDVEEDVESL